MAVLVGSSTATAIDPVDDSWDISAWVEVCEYDTSELPELSGLAPSRKFAKVLWAVNDSGNTPKLYALDARTCETLAEVTLGHGMADVEALATGVNAAGEPTVWVGDIGDNGWSRSRVRVWEFAEPDLSDTFATGTSHTIYYPDGPRDAESMMVSPDGEWIWLVSKAASGAVYRAPADAASVTATRIGGSFPIATDAALSPDGTRHIVRGYKWAEVRSGSPLGFGQGDVDVPEQGQNEALCFSRMGAYIYTASERDPRLFRASVRPLL